MKHLYVVLGRTGGDDVYDRGRVWTVAAYTNDDAAQGHAKAAQAHASKVHRTDPYNWRDHANPYDPDMDMDTLTGTYYSVQATALKDTFETVVTQEMMDAEVLALAEAFGIDLEPAR